MKRKFFLLAACLLFSSPTWAKKATKEIKGMTAEELTWVPNPEAPNDVSVAVVRGSMKKGPHAAFHKFRPGLVMENHTHSADLHAVVISGTFVSGPEANPKTFGPGSYADVPGNVPHISKCEGTVPCILYIETSGKFDMKPVKAAKK